MRFLCRPDALTHLQSECIERALLEEAHLALALLQRLRLLTVRLPHVRFASGGTARMRAA